MSVIVVLGTGAAGDEAAFAAKKTDSGARVVLLGKEPHLFYSPCVLADYVSGEIPKEKVFLRKEKDYTNAGIELLLSKLVTGWSPARHILYFQKDELYYDRLIIATGSKPFVPPIPGIEKKRVMTLKTFDDAEMMRTAKGKAAVIVGSGPVGIETAVAFRRMGWSVSIVEFMDRILPRIFDAPLSKVLTKRLKANGIQVFLKEKVLEIFGENRAKGVRTDCREIPADMVVLVTGMKPEVELAQKAGLVTGISGGVQVNEHMETSHPDVWACGDCVESRDITTGKKGVYMLWNNARLQGRVAGANAAGADKRYPGSLNTTTVNFFEEAAASVGSLASDFTDGEAQVLLHKKSWDTVWLVMHDHRLVGVQVIGKTERVGALVGLILRGQDIRKTILKGSGSSIGFWIEDLLIED